MGDEKKFRIVSPIEDPRLILSVGSREGVGVLDGFGPFVGLGVALAFGSGVGVAVALGFGVAVGPPPPPCSRERSIVSVEPEAKLPCADPSFILHPFGAWAIETE